MKKLLPFWLIGLLLNSLPLYAEVNDSEEAFLSPSEAYQPTVSIISNTLVIDWRIEDGYFLYRHGFKLHTQDEQEIPFSQDVGQIKYDEFLEKNVEIYHNDTQMRANIGTLLGEVLRIKIGSQGCADAGLCFPPTEIFFDIDENASVQASNTAQSAPTMPVHPASNHQSASQLLLTILGAFIGGLILNLMPCVFPVLSLKALSFSSEHESKSAQHHHGWAYTAGVILSFVTAAVIIFAARAAGESLGWGFQLQHPIFVTLMIYLFFVMGLSLSGFFEFGGSLMGLGQDLTTGSHLKSSFFTGVLAALVASPCTAPFMAPALGVALTQPILISLAIFIALGFGMAFPFLLLSYSPSLARLMPRPGNWMITFRQALAFPLYLTSIWLLWVLSHQSGSNSVIVTLIGMLLITLSVWVIKLPSISVKGRMIIRTLALIFFLPAGFIAYEAKSVEQASPIDESNVFSIKRLEEIRKVGAPVFVDLTADWCLTCKVNESVAFTANVKDTLDNLGGELLIGDWTNQNPDIEVLLKLHQRSGIPLYLMYPKGGGEPEILPQLLTEKMVLDAIGRATIQF